MSYFAKITAKTYSNSAKRGQTRPHFFECVNDDSGELGTFLIKSSRSPEMLARELVGNALAQLSGLRTPHPAIVQIGETLASTVNNMLKERGRFPNVVHGLGAACEMFNAGQESALDDIPLVDPESALRLYIFDMISGNSDRVKSNPNCTVDSEGLLVFDFEQCFALDEREMMPDNVEPWLVSSRGLGATHMYFSRLEANDDVQKAVYEILGEFSDECLFLIRDELPIEWHPEANRIINHVKIIKENAEDFCNDLVESLR